MTNKIDKIQMPDGQVLELNGVKKEVHICPELTISDDGYYYWTISHKFEHNNISCKLYSVSNNVLLWGEPNQITNENVIYKFSNPIEIGTIKAILIG